MPNMTVIRPAAANETVEAWKAALGHTGGPVCLVLTRQKLPTLDRGGFGAANGVARGGYVLDAGAGGDPDLILIATGSEVHIALAAAATLRAEGANVRVVNLASRELFDLQDAAYRESVLPAAVTARVAVEAAVSFGWGDIVGSAGAVVGLDRFGASAPAGELFARLGITAERVCERARELLAT